MLTRRQALKSLCAAAMASVAPIPALGAAMPAVPAANKPLLDSDGPCPSFCCDYGDPATLTMMLEIGERTYVLHQTSNGGWEYREPDGVFSVMADGNGRVEISGCC